jgi:hypothetical protein
MPEKFQCSSCQKEYKWKPELAGKRAKCKCGATIEIPQADADPPTLEEDVGAYDVAEPAPIAPPPPAQAAIPMATAVAPATAAPPSLPYGSARLPWQAQAGASGRSRCQACGADAPVKYVEFNQNVGMLVMRRRSYVKGNLCKSCINSKFWSMTLTTLAVGWLGTISLVLAPIFIIGNIIRYLGCLSLPSSHPKSLS